MTSPRPAVQFGVEEKKGIHTRIQAGQRGFLWGWVGIGALAILGVTALTIGGQQATDGD